MRTSSSFYFNLRSSTLQNLNHVQNKSYFHGMKAIFHIALLMLSLGTAYGQLLPGSDEVQQNVLDGLFDDYSNEEGGEIQPEWLMLLEDLLNKPLNINIANHEDLSVFFFLSSAQISQILTHREQYGLFLNPLELQGVDGIDILTMRRLMPFIFTGGISNDRLNTAHLWKTGKREFSIRWEKGLEDKKGFKTGTDGSAPPYEGDDNRYVGRLRYVSGNRISYGFSFEKDAGETFGNGSNSQGFDFYSAHIYMRKPFKHCSQLVIGDYGLNLGQGMLISTGFSANKSPDVGRVKRVQRTIFPMNSWQESRFFRGTASEWRLNKHFNAIIFASVRNRDGNLVQSDSTFSEISLQVSSFQQSGLHRTQSEIDNEGVFLEKMLGGSLYYRNKRTKVGIQSVYFDYSPQFSPALQPYSQFYFRGHRLLAGSMDFQSTLRGNQLFGELAYSENGGWGGVMGLLSSPDSKLQAALLGRYFSPDYWNIWGAPFSESSLPRNESGLYTGLVLRPSFPWTISAFVDVWQHPWLTFQSSSPVRGTEKLIKIEYREKRKWLAYAQYRWKGRNINQSNATEIPNQSATFRQQLRMQVQFEVNKILTLRTRLEWSNAGTGPSKEDGYLVANDLIYKPLGSNLSATMRYALFRTDGFASRIYMFENDLLYTFGLRPYYHHGQRFYINLRYRPWSPLTLEVRYELYQLFNQTSIGTGNEMIDGNKRSIIKTQVRWMF